MVPVIPIEPGQVLVSVPPVVVPVVGSLDPQNVVSNTIDRIVDVKERLQEAASKLVCLMIFIYTILASSFSSTAVSEQLRQELRMVEREMDLLDPRTQASCLLKELEQVLYNFLYLVNTKT